VDPLFYRQYAIQFVLASREKPWYPLEYLWGSGCYPSYGMKGSIPSLNKDTKLS
ncbi:Hypothetical protein FKW44_023719, partial [Caligus rogercresseyi]